MRNVQYTPTHNQSFLTLHKKTVSFGILLLLILAVPVTILVARQNQDIRQNAQIVGDLPPNEDSCGKVGATVREPAENYCPTKATITDDGHGGVTIVPNGINNVSSYSLIITLENRSANNTRKVRYVEKTNFCDEPYGTVGYTQDGRHTPFFVCESNSRQETKEITLQPAERKELTISRSTPNNTACGSFQIDFWIEAVDDDSNCNYKWSQDGHVGPSLAGVCGTGKPAGDCIVSTPTVTPTPPPSCPVPGKAQNVKINCPNCSG